MPTTDDPNDPRLGHGTDTHPVPQNEVYLVLSESERAKGFVRPLRDAYVHVGAPAPQYALRDLTDDQRWRYGDTFAKFEAYPPSELPATGRFWTQQEIDNVGKGCNMVTTMNHAIAETYARSPHFYGSTYCAFCKQHFSVNEFLWSDEQSRVGS